MAQLVIAAAGAALGGSVLGTGAVLWGLTGAQIGWMAGSMLGASLVGGQNSSGPRLDDLRVTGTEYGQGIPYVIGAPRMAGDLVWASDRREVATTEEVGKGGGSSYTTYSYEIDAMYQVADQEGCVVTRAWNNGKLVYTSLASADDASRLASEASTLWRRLTVYGGGAAQLPDPIYEAAVANAPAYRGRTTILIEGLQLGNSGALPNLTFEVCSAAGQSNQIVRRYAVTDTGAGNRYRYSGSTGLGVPFIRRMSPTIAVESFPDQLLGDRRAFDMEGAATSWPSGFSPVAVGPWNGSAGNLYDRPDISHPMGTIDGLAVRVQNFYTVATGGTSPILTVGSISPTVVAIGEDLTAVIPSGKRVGSAVLCSDGLHAMVFTANAYADSSTQLTHWWLIRREGGTKTLVRSGSVDNAGAQQLTFGRCVYGFASMTGFWSGALEDDLEHVWMAYGAGQRDVQMWTIGSDDVMRFGSTLALGNGIPDNGFSVFCANSTWAEAGYCVVAAGGTFSAYRRAGDAISDVPLRTAVEALCARAGMPAGAYDASALSAIAKPVRALAVQVSTVRSALDVLQTTHAFDAHLTDKITFVPRGGAAAATIPRADLGAGEGDAAAEPFALQVGSDLEIPSQVAVVYRAMESDQQPATEYGDRGPSSQPSVETVQVAAGLLASEAKGIADGIVRDAYAARLTSQIALPLGYSHLVPTDVLLIPDDDGTLHRMRIVKRNEQGGVLQFDVVGDDSGVSVEPMATSTDYGGQAAVIGPAETVLQVLDIPLLRDADDGPGVYVAARGTTAAWPGCQVLASTNTTTFSQTVADIAESAVMGAATTALGGWSGGGIVDVANAVTVNVASGQLSSATRDALQADSSLNALLVGDEVVRFMTATLVSTSPNVYTVSNLLRGQRGTEWAMGTHAIGDRVVLLRARGLRRVSQQQSDVGVARYFKGATKGALVDAASVIEATNTGVSQAPLAPVDLRYSRDTAGNITLSWKRRTRLSATFCGAAGISVPVGEAQERYDVRIMAGGQSVRRMYPPGPSVVYTAAEQQQDFGALQGLLTVEVYQASATGIGRPLLGTVGTGSAVLTQTITLGGTFAAGLPITVMSGALQLASYTTKPADANLAGAATALAAAINGKSGYSASAAGAVVTVNGPAGVAFSLTATVGGPSSVLWGQVQSAANASAGTSYRLDMWVLNTLTGASEPIPAASTLGFSVKRGATTVGSCGYTMPAEGTRMAALQGLAAVFPGTALAAAGFTFAVGTDAGGPFARLTGPAGADDVLFVPTVSGAFVLSGSLIAQGTAPVATSRPQITDATIFGTPVAGDVYRLTLNSTAFNYTALGGDTAAAVASALAALVDADSYFGAAATDRGLGGSADTVRITGGTAGLVFIYAAGITRSITTTVA